MKKEARTISQKAKKGERDWVRRKDSFHLPRTNERVQFGQSASPIDGGREDSGKSQGENTPKEKRKIP